MNHLLAEPVTLVAILKAEDPFIEEWVVYHRLMGVDKFILYDDDVHLPLRLLLQYHSAYVTIIPWASLKPKISLVPNNQMAAYSHALPLVTTKWISYLDGDEFIVLREHESIGSFLHEYQEFGAVSLGWHMFGHNGYYDNPKGLITESLVRRKILPGNQVKTIAQREAIASLVDPHDVTLKPPFIAVDANKKPFSREHYEGKTAIAHINHYFCRSFKNWMSRVSRGNAFYDRENCPPNCLWRFSESGTLAKFVNRSRDTNELVDDYMRRYADRIHSMIDRSSR